MSTRIIDRIDFSDEVSSIVLYECMAEEVKDGRNLIRVDVDGNILWKASPPTTGMQDCFTCMQWDGQTLTAKTWSCYRVRVDLQNGNVTVIKFTK